MNPSVGSYLRPGAGVPVRAGGRAQAGAAEEEVVVVVGLGLGVLQVAERRPSPGWTSPQRLQCPLQIREISIHMSEKGHMPLGTFCTKVK